MAHLDQKAGLPTKVRPLAHDQVRPVQGVMRPAQLRLELADFRSVDQTKAAGYAEAGMRAGRDCNLDSVAG
jgi:hypothetical protein